MEESVKKEIWQENKDRYFELNPIESIGAKVLWAVIGAAIAIAVMYWLR
jgi:hypothetical protein